MLALVCSLVIAIVSVSGIFSESTPSYNSTSRSTYSPPFAMNKTRAFAFLRHTRHRRDLVEECWEGCYFGEVLDHLRWRDESGEYMLRARCRILVCPSGYRCTWAPFSQTYYHIRDINIQCKRT